jgi:hypothetical protein
MRNGLLIWVLGVLLACGRADAQSTPETKPAENEGTAGEKKSADDRGAAEEKRPVASSADSSSTPPSVPDCRPWARVEYLLWWVRNGPLPVPIVTTGNPSVGFDPTLVNTVNTAGAIGQPGTRVLFGDNPIRFPVASGGRLTLGCWVDCEDRLGFEGNGFVFQQLNSHFAAGSDATGSPPLYFPIFSGIAGAERAIPIADPLRSFSGSVSVTSALRLWGTEANAVCKIYRCTGVDFSLLAGFRTLDLRETLLNHNATRDLLFGNVSVLEDLFRTTNQFYGGQIGARLGVLYEQLSLDVTGKFAVGSAHQMVDIAGSITQLGPNPLVPPGPGSFPGGLFTQPSNIGRHNTNPVSVPLMVVPSLELKLAYEITPHVRVSAGYDFFYWSQVMRPGNQISHSVNLSQNAVLDPAGTGTLVGPAQPAPLFVRSDFWAQGFSLGIEISF